MQPIRRNNLHVFLLSVFLIACKKDPEPPSDLGLSYYPAEVGQWVAYDVMEVEHDDPVGKHDTSRYELMERIESTFIDNQGRPSLRIERFKRNNASESWQIADVWYATQTQFGLEKIEEDVRYLRMSYPVKEDREWDGNVYNTDDAWDYFYEGEAMARTYGGLSFDKTVKVNQRSNFNLVEFENAFEVYAEYVGLVKKHYKVFTIQNFDTLHPVLGQESHWEVIGYGQN